MTSSKSRPAGEDPVTLTLGMRLLGAVAAAFCLLAASAGPAAAHNLAYALGRLQVAPDGAWYDVFWPIFRPRMAAPSGLASL